MANEVAEKKPTFSVALTDKLSSIGAALPVEFNRARFVQNAIALLNDHPEIAKYPKDQIMAGLLKGATLGLDFYNGECYLIPYGSQLQYQTSYIGMQKLVRNYSYRPIKEIYSVLIKEGDEVEMGIENGEPTISIKPKLFNKGKTIGAIAVCLFRDGGMQYEAMDIDELKAVRNASKAKNSPAWQIWEGQMQRKAVIKRLCKSIGLNFENAEQIRIYNAETELETDVKVIAEQEISEGENQVEL